MHQDWTPVIWHKPKTEKTTSVSSKEVVSTKKGNTNTMHNTTIKIEYDDNKYESDNIMPVTIGKELAREIQTKRIAKKLSQKQLANILSIPVSVITQYEAATGIRNGLYVSKIKKYLDIHH